MNWDTSDQTNRILDLERQLEYEKDFNRRQYGELIESDSKLNQYIHVVGRLLEVIERIKKSPSPDMDIEFSLVLIELRRLNAR